MYQDISYDVEEPVATIRFNRPKQLNAFTNRMGDELKHALAEAERDERVVAIVLTGEGRGFCAGADLKGLQGIGEGKAGSVSYTLLTLPSICIVYFSLFFSPSH